MFAGTAVIWTVTNVPGHGGGVEGCQDAHFLPPSLLSAHPPLVSSSPRASLTHTAGLATLSSDQHLDISSRFVNGCSLSNTRYKTQSQKPFNFRHLEFKPNLLLLDMSLQWNIKKVLQCQVSLSKAVVALENNKEGEKRYKLCNCFGLGTNWIRV